VRTVVESFPMINVFADADSMNSERNIPDRNNR
jgi:hypothetical protein